MKAVQLYITYGRSAAAVVREQGYPSRQTCGGGTAPTLKPEDYRREHVLSPSTPLNRSKGRLITTSTMAVASLKPQERWDIHVSRCLESGLISSTQA